MTASFDTFQLTKLVQKRSHTKLPLEEIEELLTLSEDAYQKDSPRSVGKTLVLKSLHFTGVKNTGAPFQYDRSFLNGVNMWVGDNLKGKSTIFKIIKYCITGNNTIDKEIAGWIQNIWLEFSVGNNQYAVHIFKKEDGKTFFHELYNSPANLAKELEGEEKKSALAYAGGVGNFEEFMEDFFFREFDYYNLQWTQRSSHKSNPNLLTAKASWKTYFKSVYLEAEDYQFLFYGSQAELIFQMLLGLELTYPINRLKIKKENLEDKLGQARQAAQNKAEATPEEIVRLENERDDILEKLKLESERLNQANNIFSGDLIQKLEKARKAHSGLRKRKSDLNAEILKLESKVDDLSRNESRLRRETRDFEVEIGRKRKRIADLKEFEEIGAFFNSLEVKTCPSCDHEVEKAQILQEKTTGNCRLCNHQVQAQKGDDGEFDEQRTVLEGQIKELEKDLVAYQTKLAETSRALHYQSQQLAAREKEVMEISLENLEDEILKLEAMLDNLTSGFDLKLIVETTSNLKARLEKIEGELAALKSEPPKQAEEFEKLAHQIDLLRIAREELKILQVDLSAGVLTQLQELYIKLLRSFGLTHFEHVEIEGNFSITYTKHQEIFTFEELSAGEQLRAKLGLYIALIELDVEHQYGRHPRFIILDSPAGEEADLTFLEGLKETLAFIQDNLGNELQVFVGTAQRELEDAMPPDRSEIRARSEFFF